MKRYQIFISSTYNDLKDERQAVLECILKLRHIPVGMEQFVAANEKQFSYIKRLIDETDYYILILGNRYGSTADDGISFTEKEFDYAVSKKIPILAFVHNTPEHLPICKSETTSSARKQLSRFRKKVTNDRLVSLFTWDNPASLSREIVVALTNALHDFPRPGWERVQSFDNSELLNQINNLRMENIELKNQLDNYLSVSESTTKIAEFPWSDSILLKGRSRWSDYKDIEISINVSWQQLLSLWGPFVISEENIQSSYRALNETLFGDEEPYFSISDRDFRTMIMRFLKAGVIQLENEKIRLTNEGKNYLFENSIKVDDIIERSLLNAKSVKREMSKDNKEFQKYIKDLSNFNSNPEAINYIGETLIGISVFLSNQQTLNKEDVKRAQKIIKEILEKVSDDERTSMGVFDPIFNLSKILELISILQKGIGNLSKEE